MAMLNLRRKRSLRLRRTWRLSFKERASAMCNSRVSRPTGILKKIQHQIPTVQSTRATVRKPGCEMLREEWEANLPASGGADLRGSFCATDFLDAEGFEKVANLYVVEIGNAHAAFKSSTDFTGIVLKALERAQF